MPRISILEQWFELVIITQNYTRTIYSSLIQCKLMIYRIEDFQNDPNWKPSFGEKLGKVHFRNGHQHAVCDPNTGLCEIHYDEHDPNKSLISLFKHMKQSDLGKAVLITAGGLLLDQLLTGGQVRKAVFKSLLR